MQKNKIYLDSPRLSDFTPDVYNKSNYKELFELNKIDYCNRYILKLNLNGKKELKYKYKDISKEFYVQILQKSLEKLKKSNLKQFIDTDLLVKKVTRENERNNTTKELNKYYINYFSFSYKKYLLSVYPLFIRIDSKFLVNEKKYKNDFRKVIDFFVGYTDCMSYAKQFIKCFFNNNDEEYFIFIFQLFKQTQFHNIIALSKIGVSDFDYINNSSFYDNRIKIKIVKYTDHDRKELGFAYDENFPLITSYISNLMKLDISPSLLKYHATCFYDEFFLFHNLEQVRKVMDLVIRKILNFINKENLYEVYSKILFLLQIEFQNNDLKEKINIALGTNDNEYHFLNLLLFVLLDFY